MSTTKIKALIISCLFIITSFLLTQANAEETSSQAEAQVSQAIAEWKLINEDESGIPPEQSIDASGLLATVKKGMQRGLNIAKELASFDNDYNIKSQIRDWELNRQIKAGNVFMTQLPNVNDAYRSAGGAITINGIGWAYAAMPNAGIYPSIYGIASTTMAAPITGMENIHILGTSMQVMNPPIYLDKRTAYGLSGEGSYPIKNGRIYYQEKLITAEPSSITRTHTDWAKTNIGTYYCHTEINTPVSSNFGGKFERFATNRWPVGSQWDPQLSTAKTIKIQQSYRFESASKIYKIPAMQTGNWNTAAGSWNNIGKWNSNIGMGSYGTAVGKISTTMPNYSPLPTKMPTYTSPTFKMPSYKSTSGSGIK